MCVSRAKSKIARIHAVRATVAGLQHRHLIFLFSCFFSYGGPQLPKALFTHHHPSATGDPQFRYFFQTHSEMPMQTLGALSFPSSHWHSPFPVTGLPTTRISSSLSFFRTVKCCALTSSPLGINFFFLFYVFI